MPHGNNPIAVANDVLKGAFYLAFPLLLILQVLLGGQNGAVWAVRTVVVSAVAFVALSLLRRAIDAPRPYEVLGKAPLIEKDTRGKSFPSRHVFSCFMIAMCWLAWAPGGGGPWTPGTQTGPGPAQVVGVCLLVAGCVMAWLRVRGGVHWMRDVVAGAVAGVVAGIVGFWLI